MEANRDNPRQCGQCKTKICRDCFTRVANSGSAGRKCEVCRQETPSRKESINKLGIVEPPIINQFERRGAIDGNAINSFRIMNGQYPLTVNQLERRRNNSIVEDNSDLQNMNEDQLRAEILRLTMGNSEQRGRGYTPHPIITSMIKEEHEERKRLERIRELERELEILRTPILPIKEVVYTKENPFNKHEQKETEQKESEEEEEYKEPTEEEIKKMNDMMQKWQKQRGNGKQQCGCGAKLVHLENKNHLNSKRHKKFLKK